MAKKLKKDKEKISIIVDTIKRIGGYLSGRINQSDFFIVLDDKNRQEVLHSLKHPYDGKIITYQEFLVLYK